MMNYDTILLDLDSILDTRFATLTLNFNEEQIKPFLPGYKERHVDSFSPVVPALEFNELYKKRDKNTLANSVKTKVLTLASDYVANSIARIGSMPVDLVPRILLNINSYPDLTDKEKHDFVSVIKYFTNSMCDVEIVNISDDDLTPKFLNENVSIYFRYDYLAWLDAQAKNKMADKQIAPDIKLIAPAILPMTEDDFRNQCVDDSGANINPFNALKTALFYFIDLEFVNPDVFCYSLE